MAKHDLKAREIQVEYLLNQLGKILSKTNISYGEDRPLDQFDLVYRKYVDAITEGIATPKTTLEVTGNLTINWDSTVPSGGQTFREKHGEDFLFQGYYEDPGGYEAAYSPACRVTRNGSGNITQVQFGAVQTGRIIII